MSGKAEYQLKPWCPFCGMDVGRPTYGQERRMREFPLGRCSCGAFYVADATGHNVGAAMVECLVSACGGNWDLAWDLLPEDDYLTGQIDDYDEVTHQVVQKRNLDGRAVRGVLFFVRLHKELAEFAARFAAKQGAGAAREKSEAAAPVRQLDPKRIRMRADKQTVQRLAAEEDVEALVALYLDDRRTLRFLQRMLYTPDRAERYKTAWLLGRVCGEGAGLEPGPVADLLHRLFEACADSASSSWGMVEGIGAIIANRPDIYGAFTRHLFAYMGDPGTREAVLWGLGEIAASRPDLIRALPFYSLFPVLTHEDAVLRGLTLRLLGRVRAREAALQVMGLVHDASPVTIPERGELRHTTVAILAEEALCLIHQEEEHVDKPSATVG